MSKRKQAATDLQESLDRDGIKATVGYTTRRPIKLYVYCRFKKDLKKIPLSFGDYPVRPIFLGPLVAL